MRKIGLQVLLFGVTPILVAFICGIGLVGGITGAEWSAPIYLLGLIYALATIMMYAVAALLRTIRWVVTRVRKPPLPASRDRPYNRPMSAVRNIVVLTGAGVSAESGIPVFRTAGDGSLGWDTGKTVYRIEDVCTPQALAADAALVHRFYDQRRAALADVAPNAAHVALARLDREWDGGLLIVTQNVDDLHERAGTRRLLHMHGALRSALCAACGARQPWDEALPPGARCAACGAAALRPDIVFFGEMPYEMERIEAALAEADLFVSIGTSGAVYPAAGFVQLADAHGADTLELNLDRSAGSGLFTRTRLGPAATLVPAWVEAMLAGGEA